MTRALTLTGLSLADRLPDGTPDTEAVARQERACRAHATARGWAVVGVGTRSTRNPIAA